MGGKAEGERKEARVVQTASDQEKWGRGFRMEQVPKLRRLEVPIPGAWKCGPGQGSQGLGLGAASKACHRSAWKTGSCEIGRS